MDVNEFVIAAEIAFERLMTPTKGLRPEVMEEELPSQPWSFKDLGLHLAISNAENLAALEAIYHGREIPDGLLKPCQGVSPGGAASMPLKRVMTELRIGHSAVVEAVRRVKWGIHNECGTVPGWLEASLIEHYELHRLEVEEWVRTLTATGRGPLTSLPMK